MSTTIHDVKVLHRRWVHSHEEDSETERVFRPATYAFPPSRGRKSFELKPSGALVEQGIGATDRPVRRTGTWKLEADNILAFYRGSSSKPERVMRIVSVDRDRMVTRNVEAGERP